MKIRQDDITY